MVLTGGGIEIGHGPAAAHQLDAHAVPEALDAQQLDQSDLSGGGDVGAAAGAGVRPGEGDDAYLPVNGLLAPVVYMLQLLRGGVKDLRGAVLPQVAVDLRLQLLQLCLVQFYVQVDGDHVGSHVEADVVTAIFGVGQAGDDMLAGVLLHQVEPTLPVNGAGHLLPRRKGSVTGVNDRVCPGVDLQHVDAAQHAGVVGLAAALGVEGGLV